MVPSPCLNLEKKILLLIYSLFNRTTIVVDIKPALAQDTDSADCNNEVSNLAVPNLARFPPPCLKCFLQARHLLPRQLVDSSLLSSDLTKVTQPDYNSQRMRILNRRRLYSYLSRYFRIFSTVCVHRQLIITYNVSVMKVYRTSFSKINSNYFGYDEDDSFQHFRGMKIRLGGV